MDRHRNGAESSELRRLQGEHNNIKHVLPNVGDDVPVEDISTSVETVSILHFDTVNCDHYDHFTCNSIYLWFYFYFSIRTTYI